MPSATMQLRSRLAGAGQQQQHCANGLGVLLLLRTVVE
jgi:hypothetical protein